MPPKKKPSRSSREPSEKELIALLEDAARRFLTAATKLSFPGISTRERAALVDCAYDIYGTSLEAVADGFLASATLILAEDAEDEDED